MGVLILMGMKCFHNHKLFALGFPIIGRQTQVQCYDSLQYLIPAHVSYGYGNILRAAYFAALPICRGSFCHCKGYAVTCSCSVILM